LFAAFCFFSLFHWSLAFWEENRLRVFENRALRRAFGTKREEVTGGRRELLNEELHNLYTCRRILNLIFYMCYMGEKLGLLP
jgi:hypothetical protein